MVFKSYMCSNCFQCFNSVAEQSWEHVKGEWKQEKHKVLNSMIGPSGNFLILEKGKSPFIDPVVTSSILNRDETIYATKVIEYNSSVIRGLAKPNLVELLSKAAEEFHDPVS